MSRSYKHSPICTDGSARTTKLKKRLANKKVRRNKLLHLKGKSYKKLFNSYDIHDFASRETREDALNAWEQMHKFPAAIPNTYSFSYYCRRYFNDKKQYLQKAWYKYYHRK